MLNLLICNNRLEDVENINKNINIFKSTFINSKVYIFHDSTAEGFCYSKNAEILSLNKNIGLLAARKYLVEHIPYNYDNDYFTWLDSDDTLDVKKLKLYYEEIYKNNWNFYGLLQSDRVWNKIYKLSLLKKAYNVIPKDMYNFKILYYEDLFLKDIMFDLLSEDNFNNIRSDNINFINYNGYHAPNLSNLESAKKFFESLFLKETWGLNKISPFKASPKQLSIIIYNHMKHYGENYILDIINDIIKRLPEKYHSYFNDIITNAYKIDSILNAK